MADGRGVKRQEDHVTPAEQAWMVLKGRGYTRVYTLLEGLDAWKDEPE